MSQVLAPEFELEAFADQVQLDTRAAVEHVREAFSLLIEAQQIERQLEDPEDYEAPVIKARTPQPCSSR
jgi:hypothetical protein